ncbi:MAG TPA: PAS domain S-box protein, partial [Gallionella sp.]|nr:PAS domain S-box protein [Gallionella sp.]
MADNNGSNKLLQAFFSPAVAMMGRLNVAGKFMLLGLMSLAAMAVVMYSLFVSLERDIGFSQRELQGLELIKPFPHAVRMLQRHRGLSAGLLGGDEAIRDRCAVTENEAAEAFKAMEEKLPPGLASSEDFRRIRTDWERLRKEGFNWTAAENFAAHTRLIDLIQSFEGMIADEYALILDPELNTYYLIDTIVNQLPHALEHLGQLRAYGTGVLASKQITAQQQIELNILIGGLDDALGILNTNLDKTGRHNPALQGLISTASGDIADSVQQITGLVKSDIFTGHLATLPGDFFGMSTASIDRSYMQLHETLLPAAETLLKARIARAQNALRFSVGIAFLLFLAVAYFSAGIIRAIIGNIQSIARSAHAFAGGDLSERIDLGARDELGQVGDSFNEMADGFSALLKVSRENEARLQDLSAHLEERVKERTIELERAQRETEVLLQRNQTLMMTSMDGIHVMDIQGNIVDANDAFCHMLGYTREEAARLNVADWDAQWSVEELRARFREIIGKSAMFETLHRRKDGTLINVEISASGMELEGQSFIFASGRDITRRKQADEALRIMAAAFETQDAIMITDASANIIRVNQAFQDITGYSSAEVLGKNPRMMNSGRQNKVFYAEMWRQLIRTGTWSGEIWDKRKNGQIYPKWMTVTAIKNERQETTQYVAIFSDITERKRAEEEIRNLAFYDALTKLPNRRLFIDRFHAALPVSARHNNYGAVCFIDLDNFKVLNDTFGHDCGDLLLIEVAARIKSCVREMDTVARLGGDEFVVLVEEISDDRDEASRKVGLVAEKIRESLARPYDLNGHEHHSSPSIGVSLYRGNEEPVSELLQHA